MHNYHYNLLVSLVLFFLLLKVELYNNRLFFTGHLVMYQTFREHLPFGSIFCVKFGLGQTQALIKTCCIILSTQSLVPLILLIVNLKQWLYLLNAELNTKNETKWSLLTDLLVTFLFWCSSQNSGQFFKF